MSYAIVMTIVFGALLAFVSESLGPRQRAEVLLEKQMFILKAALGEEALGDIDKKDIPALYTKTVAVDIINASGKMVEGDETKISILKEYKKYKELKSASATLVDLKVSSDADPTEIGDLTTLVDSLTRTLKLPIYSVKNADNLDIVEAYVIPVYGEGLWDFIWGYLAIEGDLETVKGIIFDHKGETPGLGARITDAEVQLRFKGKKIYNTSGELDAPHFQKGEGSDYSSNPHKVDGLSGATITANGVNKMLDSYLELYQPYINAQKK